ncbi:MAG TPA: hypothetical protein VFL41_08100 [Gaiellaceae bacterium]|nr:hypothetical protein [Gaiellaceae bacterium]
MSAKVVNPGFLPGGYGTEAHNHLLGHGHAHAREERQPAPVPAPAEEAAA